MTDKFEKGDLVRLKSGGPTMTVSKVGGPVNPPIHCKWFSDGKVQSASFGPESLTKVEEDDEG